MEQVSAAPTNACSFIECCENAQQAVIFKAAHIVYRNSLFVPLQAANFEKFDRQINGENSASILLPQVSIRWMSSNIPTLPERQWCNG